MSLPRPLGHFLYSISSAVRRIVPAPERTRTRIAVVLNERETLLVKNWFGSQLWTLPGGGVKRRELPLHAAVRELHEETGIRVDPLELTFLGHMPHTGYPSTVMVYRADLKDEDSAAAIPRSAQFEITDLAWHPIVNLPIDRQPLVDQALSQQ